MHATSHRIAPFALLIASGVTRAQERAAGADPIAAALDEVRAAPREQRWRLVPWLTSLKAALARAGETGKPVFLFGYDGTLANGNC